MRIAVFVALFFGAIQPNYAHVLEGVELEKSVENWAVGTIKVRAWEALHGDGSDLYRAYSSNIANLTKVDDYLGYNPNKVDELKDAFQAASNKDEFIRSFIGGSLRKNELEELGLLKKEAADLADNYPPQYLNQTKQARLAELKNQLGNYEYISKLNNVESGVQIRFKSEYFNPVENAYQNGASYTWISTKISENRIYGATPLPPSTPLYRQYNYVITLEGDLRLGIGHFHLSGNAGNVLGAGRLKVNNEGKIFWIDGSSGHYRPTNSQLDNSVQMLRDNNLTTSDVITYYE